MKKEGVSKKHDTPSFFVIGDLIKTLDENLKKYAKMSFCLHIWEKSGNFVAPNDLG